MAVAEVSQQMFNHLFPQATVEPRFRDRMFDILQGDPTFPSFPAAIAKLQERLNHPHTGLEEIAELVRLDPALSARLLALARSAIYGGTAVSSIEEALLRLGLKETRAAIMATKFVTRFENLKVDLDWNTFWLHSLLTARLAQAIAEVYHPTPEKAYLSGLLHDSGKLVLAHYFPTEFSEIIHAVRGTGASMHEVERRILGSDHGAIGAALCTSWGMDEETVVSIYHLHNKEARSKYQLLANCLNVADSVANRAEDNIHSRKQSLEQEEPAGLYKTTTLISLKADRKATIENDEISSLPEWALLQEYKPRKLARISIQREVEKARSSMESLAKGAGGSTASQ